MFDARADADARRRDGRRAPAGRRPARTRRARRPCWSSTSAAPRPTCIRSRRASRRATASSSTGLPEPRVKRTVEGDLGMRHNAAHDRRSRRCSASSRPTAASPQVAIARRCSARSRATSSTCRRAPTRQRSIEALAGLPCGLAVQRHAGTRRDRATPCTVRSPCSAARICPTSTVVIGTGGPLAHGATIRRRSCETALADRRRSVLAAAARARACSSIATTYSTRAACSSASSRELHLRSRLAHACTASREEMRMNASRQTRSAKRAASRRREFRTTMFAAHAPREPRALADRRGRRPRRGGRAPPGAAAAQAARVGHARGRGRAGAA